MLINRNKIYIFLSITLLSMILSRLVWMQLRPYEVYFSQSSKVALKYSLSPNEISEIFSIDLQDVFTNSMVQTKKYKNWLIQPIHYILAKIFKTINDPLQKYFRWHWICIFLTILSSLFLTRFLTSSWLLALIISAALMSRGAFLARIGSLTENIPLSLCFTLWFTSTVHFMKSGSKSTYFLSQVFIFFGTLMDYLFCTLSLALPILVQCYKPFLARFEAPKIMTEKKQHFNRIFSSLKLPFLLWIKSKKIENKLIYTGLVFFILMAFFSFSIKLYFLDEFFLDLLASLQAKFLVANENYNTSLLQSYLKKLAMPVDLQYSVSLIFIITRLLLREKQSSFFSSNLASAYFMILITIIILFFTSGFKFFLEALILDEPTFTFTSQISDPALPFSHFLIWSEPVILTLGIIAFYHMLKSKVWRRF